MSTHEQSESPSTGKTPTPSPTQPTPPDAEPPAVVDVDRLPGGLRTALEAILMVTDEPIPADRCAQVLGVDLARVLDTVRDLREEYDTHDRGFELRELAEGWRIYSRAALADAVERFFADGARTRLTKAALETLAIVAYRQPIARARISAIRGVNVDGVVRTLLSRGLITEVGLDQEHGAVLYGTTPFFLDRLGIGSLDELPPLAPYLPEVVEVTDPLSGLDPDRDDLGGDL